MRTQQPVNTCYGNLTTTEMRFSISVVLFTELRRDSVETENQLELMLGEIDAMSTGKLKHNRSFFQLVFSVCCNPEVLPLK